MTGNKWYFHYSGRWCRGKIVILSLSSSILSMRIELNAKPNRCLWFPYANGYQITSHNSNHTITMATTNTLYLTTNKIITTLMIIIASSYSQIVRIFTQSVKIIHFFLLLITKQGAQNHYSKYFIEFYKKKLIFAKYLIFDNFFLELFQSSPYSFLPYLFCIILPHNFNCHWFLTQHFPFSLKKRYIFHLFFGRY